MPPMQNDDEYDAIVQGWECRETEHGVPYYLNESLKKSAWDHPYYTKVFEQLDKYQPVHYAAYRTVLKIRHLQKKFGLHLLSLQCLQDVLEDHGFPLGCTGLIDCQSLQLLLLDMFHTADFRHFDSYHQDVASELLLNYLLNMLDRERSGNMSVRSVKLIMAALCNATLPQKYRYFWEELQTSYTHTRKDVVAAFIQDLIQIPDLIKESSAFGKNVTAAVSSCMKVAGSDGAGISERGFYSWLMREPQTIIWLPTLHRLVAAEAVKHDCKCSVCKGKPIVGFRYKCLQCFKYNICQDCFFHGRVSKQHQLGHPIQEYCFPATHKDDTKAFIQIIHNKLRPRSRRRKKLAYLPVDSSGHLSVPEGKQKEEAPPPLSVPGHSSIEIIVEQGTLSEDDSGHSSDNGDGSISPYRAPPSLSPLSCYDNSTSPARSLQEPKPKVSPSRMTDRHSLIHLVHRLRQENRALRQQLRGGFYNHGDKEMWTSHATAEVIAEVTVEPTCALQVFPDLSRSGSQDTVPASQEPSRQQSEKEQPELPISPITEASTAASMCYTSECFNSILDGDSLHSRQSSTDSTIKDFGIHHAERVVLASTPAQSSPFTVPVVAKTGPPKPPRGREAGELHVRFDVDAVYIDEVQEHDAEAGEETSTLWSARSNSRECTSTVNTTRTDTSHSTPTSVPATQGQVQCDRRWLRMSSGSKTSTPTRYSVPAATVHKEPSLMPSDKCDDLSNRRRSTGTLDTFSVHSMSGQATPKLQKEEELLYGQDLWGLSTPGTDRSLFGLSKADSCLLTPEKAEIEAMLQWIDTAFPPSLTYSALSLCPDETTNQGCMLRAAEDIGQAMADLVEATADKCYM